MSKAGHKALNSIPRLNSNDLKQRLLALQMLLCFGLLLPIAALHAEQKSGQLVRDTPLYSKSSQKSDLVTTLETNTKVAVYQRQRAWYQVDANGHFSGWINMLNVRLLGTAKRQGELGLSSLYDSIQNQAQPTVSTGVRGFDEEDIMQAKADMKQIDLLELYTVSKDSARQFAQNGQLASKAHSLNK